MPTVSNLQREITPLFVSGIYAIEPPVFRNSNSAGLGGHVGAWNMSWACSCLPSKPCGLQGYGDADFVGEALTAISESQA
ncbi:MAG TPA: hypothetical protein VG759_09935 [Candidatus Angelobacter sp.]|jgi:hypothetical protein|nr:hypothetical protein [Candidatus Angelobacter sp.]